MGLTPLVFTGVSKYSEDFQSIVNRAVSIAQLPVKALQQDQQEILTKKTAMGGLESAVAALGSSLKKLSDIGSTKSLVASSSTYSLANATITGSAQPGIYTIGDITSLATRASSVSASFSDPSTVSVTSASNYVQLSVGSQAYDIQLTNQTNNLYGLRDAINASNAGVTASVIQTGGSTPEYRLSIASNNTGENRIELRTVAGDSASNILPTVDAGSDALFEIAGQAVRRKSNTVTDVIPGATLTLTGKTTSSETATIQISSSRAPLSSALTDLVNAYNATVDQVDSHSGKDAGALRGDPIIYDIRGELRDLVSYQGTGTVQTLRDLGITLDNGGKLSFDHSVIDGMTNDQANSAFEFIGSATTGLAAFASRLNNYTDASSGLFENQQEEFNKTNDSLTEKINTLNERIQNMQTTLQAKLQAADVLMAQLERQQGVLTASIQSLNLTLYGKSTQQ